MENTTLEPDFLQGWSRFLDLPAIRKHRDIAHKEHISISHWDKHRERLSKLPVPPSPRIVPGDTVHIELDPEYIAQYNELIKETLYGLLPWRTGPYCYGGHTIDAEWSSYFKWNRLKDSLPRLTNRRIADIGCNNGYFMYQLLEQDPQLILGLDPSGRCYYQHHFLTRGMDLPALHLEPLGLEHLRYFKDFFHVALCMGVLYHRRDPYSACRLLYECLKKESMLVLETLIYPGEEPIALCPTERYAKMRNVWYVPTLTCLKVWLERAGFKNLNVIDITMTTPEEQKQTTYAPYESLRDFLDPENPQKTVEGYHAPTRVLITAETA